MLSYPGHTQFYPPNTLPIGNKYQALRDIQYTFRISASMNDHQPLNKTHWLFSSQFDSGPGLVSIRNQLLTTATSFESVVCGGPSTGTGEECSILLVSLILAQKWTAALLLWVWLVQLCETKWRMKSVPWWCYMSACLQCTKWLLVHIFHLFIQFFLCISLSTQISGSATTWPKLVQTSTSQATSGWPWRTLTSGSPSTVWELRWSLPNMAGKIQQS